MNVALIQCPPWGTFDPPIGLAQISSYLKKQGHQVRSFDLNIKLYSKQSEDRRGVWAWEESDFWYHPENLKKFFSDNSKIIDCYFEQILEYNISIAGFSVNAVSRLSSLEFARRLKERNKEINIVFGGPVFLRENFINDVLHEECVDIVIPGEGLLAFSDLIDALKSGKKIDSCKGLVFKRGGSIVNTGIPFLVDLDSLPFLDLTDLPLGNYDSGSHLSLMASRGCIRRCVFCSDVPCWPGYRAMSGRRIFEEVKFYKDRYENRLGHIDFMDLIFNGNMSSLTEFCDLMIKADIDLTWTANMYIRPEMTYEVIKKMKAAKCAHIIIGIESGSEKVLRSMNKYYNIADADRIVRQMHDAGICVTANFMFGFPGETEEDFELTLDFLRRNGKYMGVYPSRTYCALEELSHLEKHLEEFDIKLDPPNYLFWKSVDGKNTYPLRMNRCRRFCELALELGVEITVGVQTTVELDEWFNLGCYYEFEKDYPKAIVNFLNYFRKNSANTIVKNKLLAFQKLLPDLVLDKDTKGNFEKAIDIIVSGKSSKKGGIRTDRVISSAFVKLQMDKLNEEIEQFKKEKGSYSDAMVLINNFNRHISCYKSLSEQRRLKLSSQFNQLMQKISVLPLRQINQRLNEAEFEAKKVWLDTFPVYVYLPFSGVQGDFRYIFESEDEVWGKLSLERFEKYKKGKINFLLAYAKRCIFKGGGGFSLDLGGGKILDYFEQNYPGLEKEIFTKGVNFSREVVNKLGNYLSDCIINFALHASNRALHRKISNKDNFNEIRRNLGYLSQVWGKSKNIILNITYTATVLNIVDLPNVISLAAELGVDRVIVDYNYIYTAEQKDISCFFRQDLTNDILDMAESQAKDLGLAVQLPPKFNQDSYPESVICRNPWSQIALSSDGKVFPCEHFRIWDVKFNDSASLQQTWNSIEYKAMRRSFKRFACSECSAFCRYVNPRQVNSLRSHLFNISYAGFADVQTLQKDSSFDLDTVEMEKVVDLAENYFNYHHDLVSSEKIIKDALGKVKYPSRLFRLLAGIHREKAKLVNSTFEREQLLKLAQEEVEKSLAIWPSDPYTYAEAARIYSALGHYKRAEEAIKRALSLAPQEEKLKLLKGR